MEKPCWMQGDKCLVHLYFRKPGDPGEDSASLSLDESFSMVLSGSLASDRTTPLFSVSSWSKKGDTDVYYEGTIDLNTQALADAFAADKVPNPGNTERITYRANIIVSRQSYSGETAPGSVALPAALLTSPDGDIWRLGVGNDGEITGTKIA